MEPRYLIRAAIAASVVGHAALVVGAFFADARPFDPVPTQNIAVDIVTPQQVAEATREAEKPPEPEKQPDPFRLPELTDKQTLSEASPQSSPSGQQASQKQAAQHPVEQPAVQQPAAQQQASSASPPSPSQPAQSQSLPSQPQPSQPSASQPPAQQQAALQPQPTASPTPAQPEPDITVKYGVMLGLPDGNGGGPALTKADIAPLDIEAFRRHLRSCSVLPAGISRSDNVRVVLRTFLAPNGRLTTEPMLIEAPASAKGPLLMQAAMKALDACQPFAMLPADKYNEWKVLDLPFTPQDFAG